MSRQRVQLELPRHGGRRKGAGRPKGDRVSHMSRPAFARPAPSHVTLRVRDDVPSLRSSRRFAAIRRSFAAVRGRDSFRLVEFSVLGNHLHLIVEADDSDVLSRGMQGLAIRLAKALNKALGRKGTLFADHYHSRLLKSPAEVARALAYVRTNAERHYGGIEVDYYSSSHAEWRHLLAVAGTWLLGVGWKLARRRLTSPASCHPARREGQTSTARLCSVDPDKACPEVRRLARMAKAECPTWPKSENPRCSDRSASIR
jgi:REP element-mobilizing transposase RayT